MPGHLQSDPRNALLLTPEEAADVLRISRTRIFQLIGAGDLASVRLGRTRRIPQAAIADFVASLTQGGIR